MKTLHLTIMILCLLSSSCNTVFSLDEFVSAQCIEGEQRCTGNSAEQCTQGVWNTTACSQQTCVNGACTGVCAPGEKQCNGQQPQNCDAWGHWRNDGDGCVGQTCVDGACLGECAPGQTSCSADATTTLNCAARGLWKATTVCKDQTCLGGACVGECAPGNRCLGNTPQTCNGFGEWLSGPSCSAGQVCSGGSCTCITGDLRCYENTPQRCNESNQWENSSATCVNQTCDVNVVACVGECEQGAQQCGDANTSQTCNGQGKWETIETCSALGCFNGQCAACDVGQRRCTGNTPQVCGMNKQWEDAPACDENSTCVAGTCGGECGANATRCSGNWPQTCDASGFWQYAPNPCPEGESCYQGTCLAQCVPDSRRCVGDFPQTCDVSGIWQNAGPACGQCIECNQKTGLCEPQLECHEPVAISTGNAHTCVMFSNGSMKCWGRNLNGQLGLGDTVRRGDNPGEMGKLLPTIDLGVNVEVAAISAGGEHTCALTTDGKVKCWGFNQYGQLGQGHNVTLGDNPNEMGDNLPFVNLGTNVVVVEISAGKYHTCARLSDGKVKCWGNNGNGQCGFGTTKNRGTRPDDMGDDLPAVDLGTGATAKAISVGGFHTCALLNDGRVKCWGSSSSGQVGLGDSNSRGGQFGEMGDNLPAVNLGTGLTAIAISADEQHTCALLSNGSVKCWGRNNYGRLGLGDPFERGSGFPGTGMGDALPAVDLGLGAQAVGISAGGTHTCALLANAKIKCWGSNAVGQLGLGDTNSRGDNPNEMGAALSEALLGAAAKVKALSAGGEDPNSPYASYTCVLLVGGSVKCWGANGQGQLGYGDVMDRGKTPTEVGDNLAPVDL